MIGRLYKNQSIVFSAVVFSAIVFPSGTCLFWPLGPLRLFFSATTSARGLLHWRPGRTGFLSAATAAAALSFVLSSFPMLFVLFVLFLFLFLLVLLPLLRLLPLPLLLLLLFPPSPCLLVLAGR
jgi:hypothetical protein